MTFLDQLLATALAFIRLQTYLATPRDERSVIFIFTAIFNLDRPLKTEFKTFSATPAHKCTHPRALFSPAEEIAFTTIIQEMLVAGGRPW
jgi:hypothetical protein